MEVNYKKFILPAVTNVDEPYVTRKLAEMAMQTPGSLNLASGMPCPDTFPLVSASFKYCDGTDLTVDNETMKKILPYQMSRGMSALREWITRIHQEFHNPPTFNDPNTDRRFSVVAMPGAMGSMNSLFKVLLDKDDIILMEEFSFGGTKRNVKLREAVPLGLVMDEQGIIPDDLRDAMQRWKERAIAAGVDKSRDLKKPRVLYTVPAGQNPTGRCVPVERKKEIYKIAQEHDLLIVEDDPYYYLQFSGILSPSYQSLDVDGRVIRLDSAAKLIAPSIRLGWVSGPEAIVREVAEIHVSDTMAVSSLTQIFVLKVFDHLGMEGFRKRILELQQCYKEKLQSVEDALNKWMPDLIEWERPQAGIYIWLKFKNIDDSLFLAEAELCRKHNIYAVPGHEFACDFTRKYSQFRICFTYVNDVDEAIKRLSDLVREFIARSESK